MLKAFKKKAKETFSPSQEEADSSNLKVKGIGTSPITRMFSGLLLWTSYFVMKLIGRPMSMTDLHAKYLMIYRPDIDNTEDAKTWLKQKGYDAYTNGCYQAISEKLAYLPTADTKINANSDVVVDAVAEGGLGANATYLTEKFKVSQALKERLEPTSTRGKLSKVTEKIGSRQLDPEHTRVLAWIATLLKADNKEANVNDLNEVLSFYMTHVRSRLNVPRHLPLRALHTLGFTFIRTGTLAEVDDALAIELKALGTNQIN